MGVLNNKILQTEVNNVKVASVPGVKLTGTVEENKAVFDKYPDLIVRKFNELIDLLSTSGVDSIPTQLTQLSGVLPVTHGGTGGTSITDARNHLHIYSKTEIDGKLDPQDITITGLPTGTTYKCEYIPHLKMCFVYIRLTGIELPANTRTPIGTISAHIPSKPIPLTLYPFTLVTQPMYGRLDSTGELSVIPQEARPSNSYLFLSGFWFTE